MLLLWCWCWWCEVAMAMEKKLGGVFFSEVLAMAKLR
jgi:hypothetical protein